MQVVVVERISKKRRKKKEFFLFWTKKLNICFKILSVFPLVTEGDKVYSQYLSNEYNLEGTMNLHELPTATSSTSIPVRWC